MTGVTVEKLAEQFRGGMPLDKLIEHLNRAGVQVRDSQDLVTEDDRQKLLELLKKDGGEESLQPKKISLKRKSVSEITVKRASGKSSVVSVVRKRRRVYVKRDPNEDTDDDATGEEETPSAVAAEAETSAGDQTPGADGPTTPTGSATEPTQATAEGATAKSGEVPESEAAVPAAEPIAAPAPTPPPAAAEPSADKGGRRRGKSKTEDAGKDESGHKKGKSRARLVQESDTRRDVVARRRSRGGKRQKGAAQDVNPHAFAKPTEPITYDVKIPETITVAELAKLMSVKAAEVIKAMMKMGAMATINQIIDQDTACLVVEEMGHNAQPIRDTSIEESLSIEYDQELSTRSPIVTVMGHVDHGKTSLLDYIRRSRTTAQEAGGITQHIGAYQVKTENGEITFLDTPGHSAFTAMRARGANCTDLVILVVAADDGVMPQTVEAIQHAKAAQAPIIVAINKVDKPEADIDRVTNELSQYDLIPESWGGDVMFVQVSAKEGTGIDELLESIMVQAELLELQAASAGPAQGVVIEARVDRGRGSVATVLVQSGQLNAGDMVLAGLEYGRIKAMNDDARQPIRSAGPSVPVEILGLSGTPLAGDTFQVVEDERKAREVALFRQGKHREVKLSRQQASKLEGFIDRMQQGELKTLNIVLKGDVQGSVEALTEALGKLSTDEIAVKIIGQGVGGFNESDINLAMASQAVLIGFNVRAEASARRLAQTEGIDINYYSIIYDVIDGVKHAMSGRLGPQFTEQIVGLAQVREVFRSAKIGAIAGCMVIEGTVKRGNPIRVLRDNVVIYEGELESLRRFRDNVNEVRNGMECGIGVKNYNDVKVGDQIEVFETIEVARELSS